MRTSWGAFGPVTRRVGLNQVTMGAGLNSGGRRGNGKEEASIRDIEKEKSSVFKDGQQMVCVTVRVQIQAIVATACRGTCEFPCRGYSRCSGLLQ